MVLSYYFQVVLLLLCIFFLIMHNRSEFLSDWLISISYLMAKDYVNAASFVLKAGSNFIYNQKGKDDNTKWIVPIIPFIGITIVTLFLKTSNFQFIPMVLLMFHFFCEWFIEDEYSKTPPICCVWFLLCIYNIFIGMYLIAASNLVLCINNFLIFKQCYEKKES